MKTSPYGRTTHGPRLDLQIAKQVRELTSPSSDSTLKLAIADLAGQLADITLHVAELKTLNAELLRQFERLSVPAPVDFRDGVYFMKDGDDGRYCPACYDSGGK